MFYIQKKHFLTLCMYTIWSIARFTEQTNMGYKFLEIEINVGLLSYVDIALRDHCGHELSLFFKTWKSFYE